MNNILNNRELAIAIYIVLFIIWACLTGRETRKSVLKLFSIIFTTGLIDYFLAMLIYSMVIILILTTFKFWDFNLLKDSLFWFFFAGFPLLTKIGQLKNSKSFIKDVLKESFKGIIVVEFLSSFYTFNLIIELILILFLRIINLLPLVIPSERLVNLSANTNMIFGMVIICFIGYNLYQNLFGFINVNTLKSFLLPIILTVSIIPLLYSIALKELYRIIYLRMSMNLKEKELKRFLKYRLVRVFKINLNKLRIFQKQLKFQKLTTKEHIKNALKVAS